MKLGLLMALGLVRGIERALPRIGKVNGSGAHRLRDKNVSSKPMKKKKMHRRRYLSGKPF